MPWSRSKKVFLLNASPEPFDEATSNFPGQLVTLCGGFSVTFCVAMTQRSRSKVKKREFAMVYHRLYSSLCLELVILSRLFIAALWSPAGKGLTYWLLFVMFNCVFVTFPCAILGQVWRLIVSFPHRCRLSYSLYTPSDHTG